jgi:hypothetical protein
MEAVGIINAAQSMQLTSSGRVQMVTVADIPNRYLRLAIEHFERAERTDNPQLKAKLRKLAGEYRDKALQIIGRAVGSPKAD